MSAVVGVDWSKMRRWCWRRSRSGRRWRCRRRERRWPKVAMHVTYRGAAAVLEVGEEEPGGLTKTLRGRGNPHRGRRRGDSLRRQCAETAKMTACSHATPRRGDVAAGRESMQRRNHQRRTRLGRRVGSWWRGPKVAALRPEGATQQQPDARSAVTRARRRSLRRRALDWLIRPMAT
jgi:hypothetical protein